jgi:hypothetical protein
MRSQLAGPAPSRRTPACSPTTRAPRRHGLARRCSSPRCPVSGALRLPAHLLRAASAMGATPFAQHGTARQHLRQEGVGSDPSGRVAALWILTLFATPLGPTSARTASCPVSPRPPCAIRPSTSPCLLAVARTSTPTCPPPRGCRATEGRPQPARRGWRGGHLARPLADDAGRGRKKHGGESREGLTAAAADVKLTLRPRSEGTVLPQMVRNASFS